MHLPRCLIALFGLRTRGRRQAFAPFGIEAGTGRRRARRTASTGNRLNECRPAIVKMYRRISQQHLNLTSDEYLTCGSAPKGQNKNNPVHQKFRSSTTISSLTRLRSIKGSVSPKVVRNSRYTFLPILLAENHSSRHIPSHPTCTIPEPETIH